MIEVHKFEDGPYGDTDKYLVLPQGSGNAVVVRPWETRVKGVDATTFRFSMYNVHGYTRLPKPGESCSEWEEAAQPQSNMTDDHRRAAQPALMTYPEVRIAPPLREPGHTAAAVGVVGTAYIRLQQDPTSTPAIAQELIDAGVPFNQVTVAFETTRPA